MPVGFTLTGTGEFYPSGTTVAVYPRANMILGQAPSGASVTSAVAGASSVAFSGLEYSTAYVAYALVGGEHRYKTFTAAALPPGVVEGPQGAQGIQGLTGIQGPAGVGALWRGVWASGTTYAIGDGVYRNAVAYVSNTAGNLNHDPATDNGTNWGVVTNRNPPADLVANAKTDFGALGTGRYVSDAGITTGTALLSSSQAAFTAADIGKHVLINGAAGAGLPLHTTILSVAAGVATLAANASATVSNATCVYGTDDTAAIQNAINYVFTNGGGRVVIPDGVYIIAGALQTAASAGTTSLPYNSQLTIPEATSAALHVAVEIQGGQGPVYPSMNNGGIQKTGTILQSMLTSVSGSSYPSVLGGPLSVSWVSLAFTYANVRMENLTVRCPQNPWISGVNFQRVNIVDICHLNVDTTEVDVATGGAGLTKPTHPTAVGLLMPVNFNNDYSHAYAASVRGFYGGIAWGEYTWLEQCQAWVCYVGFVPTPGWHSARLDWCMTLHCPYHVAYVDPSTGVGPMPPTAHGSRIMWNAWDIEHGASGGMWETWSDVIAHIYDPTNQLSGRIDGIHAVKTGGSGEVMPLIVVGAQGLTINYLNPLGDTTAGQFSRYGDILNRGGAPKIGSLSGAQVYGGGANFRTDVLAKGSLVSYWRLNDAAGSGTIVDANAAAHNGVWHGAVGLGSAGPLADANSKFAALNGLDTYGTVPQHAALSPAAALTLIALVYSPTVDPLSVSRVLAANYNYSSPAGYALLLFNGNVYFKLGATNVVNASYQLPLGQWSLVVCTYAASVGNVYVNGGLVQSNAAPASLSYSGASVGIGAYGDGTSPFAGMLAEVALCNALLTPAEVQTLYLDSVATSLSMFGGLGSVKPQITGAKAGNAAVTSLLAALAQMGLVFDNTT